MGVYYPPGYVQWALRLNCAKEGCDPPHGDDGYVSLIDPGDSGWQEWLRRATINGHAADVLTRTMPDWTEADPP